MNLDRRQIQKVRRLVALSADINASVLMLSGNARKTNEEKRDLIRRLTPLRAALEKEQREWAPYGDDLKKKHTAELADRVNGLESELAIVEHDLVVISQDLEATERLKQQAGLFAERLLRHTGTEGDGLTPHTRFGSLRVGGEGAPL